MKRFTAPLLALVIATLAIIGLRRAMGGSTDTATDSVPPAEPQYGGELRDPVEVSAHEEERDPTEHWTGRVGEEPIEPADREPGESQPSEPRHEVDPGSDPSAVPTAAPLQRYEDDDALAVRRAGQIQLVVTAERRAEAQLREAEEAGDAAAATRVAQVLRQLRVRRQALEEAATGP